MKAISLAVLSALVCAANAQQPQVPHHWQAVGTTLGKAGAVNADGSYRINWPRTDVHFQNKNGMEIPADLGLATYIALSGTAERALAVGDVAMLEPEIDEVVDALRAGGFEVVSLHNHMTAEEPRLFYVHFQAVGTPADLAKRFKPALAALGKIRLNDPTPKVGKPKLDVDGMSAAFGSKPQVFPSGVVRFAAPRSDLKVKLDGESFTPGMGLGSWAAFTACECGKTMVMGDTCVTRRDLQKVIDGYRKAGIHITAIHAHVVGASEEVVFMHYEGEGDAVELSKGIKAAWGTIGK